MKVIDSHTEGEPTRVVLSGGPELGEGSLSERLRRLSDDHDGFRQAVILEPRGSDVLVGALLCPPDDERCITGVIFFNNTGYLGMCGHGVLGVAKTLQHLGRVDGETIMLDTPVGPVSVAFNEDGSATIENVASHLYQSGVTVAVDGLGEVTGDVAWGGNWFYLIDDAPFPLHLTHSDDLTRTAMKIKSALDLQGIRGEGGALIDHVEFFSAPADPDADSRNFVLCPGGAFDRSPCGTGTSAKVASLAAKDLLAPGEVWVQESIIGSRFEACYQVDAKGQIIPSITGRAFITAEATLHFETNDPFQGGIQGDKEPHEQQANR